MQYDFPFQTYIYMLFITAKRKAEILKWHTLQPLTCIDN